MRMMTLLMLIVAARGVPAEGPNVVLIFCDDLGYGDIRPIAETEHPTPNLDRMAREGVVLTDFVVPSAVCTASRASLLTGCFNRRLSLSGAVGPTSEFGLNPDEVTIAELCRDAGYATACFGKWHLGHRPKFLPHNQGFDTFRGIPYSHDMWPLHPEDVARAAADPDYRSRWPELPLIASDGDDWRIADPAVTPDVARNFTRTFTDHATQFIHDHRDEPFFVYLAHPLPHVPLFVSEEFDGRSGAGLYGDVIMEIDDSVGRVLNAVRDAGATGRTLVIFTGDNGPWLAYGDHAGSSGGLREGKGTSFEGGIREPTIAWMPGTLPAGLRCDTLFSTVDVLPTVANLIGSPLPYQPIDGHAVTPSMLAGGDSPHASFPIYYSGGELQAVRDDRFKLVLPHGYRTLADRRGGSDGKPAKYERATTAEALYDLDADPGETTDVSADHPAVVERLRNAAVRWRRELGDKLTGDVGDGVRPPGRWTDAEADLPLVWRKP